MLNTPLLEKKKNFGTRCENSLYPLRFEISCGKRAPIYSQHLQIYVEGEYGELYLHYLPTIVVTPLKVQGVPKNTLTWKKKFIYNNLNFFICLPFKKKKKNRNTLKPYQEHPQNLYAKKILN